MGGLRRSPLFYYDSEFLPEAVSNLFGKRVLFEISNDSDNIKGNSSQYFVCMPNDNREMIKEFAALPPKSEIFGDFGRSSATTLSKRKSQEKRDNDVEDQLFVNKKHSQKK
ncbi:unnamed protein product, partial [Brassica oleracea var. botrytis]